MEAKKTGLDLLREPFPAHQISKLPKPYKSDSLKGKCTECGGYHGLPAMHLDYVGHAALTARLLECDHLWDWEPVAFGPDGLPAVDRNGGLWIRLTVCGHSRLGYGHADGKQGGNAVKEVIGDALRNAAMRFGAALDLWHKGDLHGDDDEKTTPVVDEKPKQEPLISADQFLALRDKAELANVEENKIAAAAKIDDLRQLPAALFDGVMKKLQLTIDKQKSAADLGGDTIPY